MLRKRPGARVVARLRNRAADATAGITENDDRPRIARRRGQWTAADEDAACGARDDRLADDVAEALGSPGALVHPDRTPVDNHRRTRRIGDDRARMRLAVGTVLQRRGGNPI